MRAADLLARRALTRRRGGRAGAGRRAARRRPSASRSRPASRHTASRVSRDGGGSDLGLGRAPALGAAAPARRAPRSAARRAEHEALRQRVGGEPVGAVQAGAGGLADRVEAGHAGAAVEVGDDAAHHVVARRGRRGRARSSGRGRPRAAPRRRWGSARGRRARMSRLDVRLAGSRRMRGGSRGRPRRAARARRRSARRSSSCSVAPSPRIASVIRKPSRPGTPVTAVGWNWTNSRSASAAPAARASSRPEPNEPGGLVVRDHSAAAPPVARIDGAGGERAAVVESDAGDAAVVGAAARRRARPSRTSMPGCSATSARQLAQDPPAGRAAARVRRRGGASARPRARARGCRGGRRRSGRRAPRGRGSARAPPRSGRSAAEARTSPRPASSVSCEVRLGRVVDGERGREPALGPVGRGLGQRAGGDERRRAAPSRAADSAAKSPAAPAPTTTRSARVHGDGAPYGIRVSRTVWLRHDALARATTCPGHPERPERIRRAGGARWSATTGSGATLLRGAGGATREQLLAVHPAAHIDYDRGAVRVRRRAHRRRHGRGAGDVRGGAAGGGRRGRAGRRAARRARRATGVRRRCARPGTTPSRRGRWASASSATSPSRRGGRASAHGVERVLIVDWDVHHGNGTNAIFHADPSVLFVSIHEWPLYPGTGPASDRGLGRRARATRSTCRCRRAAGDETYRSLVEHVRAAADRGRGSRSSCWSRRASTRIAIDPLATCRVTEAGLRGDDGVAAAGVRLRSGAPLGLVLEGGY